MSLFNRLMINAASIYAARVFEGFLQLAVLAFILSQVGREYYAAALLILSVQATIDLARGGMQKATVKYIAEYKARDDFVGANSILSSSSAMQGAVGILGFLACLIISPHTERLFSLPVHMQSESQWAIMLLGIGIAITFSISPWQNLVAAQERYDLLSTARVGGRIFRAVLIVALLALKAPSLISLVVAAIAGNVFERLTCICFVKKISPNFKLNVRNVSYRYIKVMLGFSLFDFFHTLSGLLYAQGSLYLAAHLISLNAVAGLGIIGNITTLIEIVMKQSSHILVPVASRLQAQGEIQKLKSLIVRGTAITVFAGGIVMACLVPWMDSLLGIWLGRSYIDLVWPAVILISAAFLVNSVTCIHNILGGIGKVAVDGISNTVCTILGLAVGISLVIALDLDLMGLAVGLFCARSLRFVFITLYGTRVFDVPVGKFLWSGYFRTYLLTAAIGLAGMLTDFSVDSWILLITAVGLSALFYLLIGIFWIVDPVDRKRFLQAINGTLEYFRIMLQKLGKPVKCDR